MKPAAERGARGRATRNATDAASRTKMRSSPAILPLSWPANDQNFMRKRTLSTLHSSQLLLFIKKLPSAPSLFPNLVLPHNVELADIHREGNSGVRNVDGRVQGFKVVGQSEIEARRIMEDRRDACSAQKPFIDSAFTHPTSSLHASLPLLTHLGPCRCLLGSWHVYF